MATKRLRRSLQENKRICSSLLWLVSSVICIGCDIGEVEFRNLAKLETEDCVVFVQKEYQPTAFGHTYMYVWRYHDNSFWLDDWDILCQLHPINRSAELSLLGNDLLLIGVVTHGGVIIDPYIVMPISDPPETLELGSAFSDRGKKWIDIVETKTHAIEKYQFSEEPDNYVIHAWIKEDFMSQRNLYILDASSVEMMIVDNSTLQVNVHWNDDIEHSCFEVRLWLDPFENIDVLLDSLPVDPMRPGSS